MIFKYLLVTFFSSVNCPGFTINRENSTLNISFGNTLTLKTLSAFQFSLHCRKEGFLTYFKTHIYFAWLCSAIPGCNKTAHGKTPDENITIKNIYSFFKFSIHPTFILEKDSYLWLLFILTRTLLFVIVLTTFWYWGLFSADSTCTSFSVS